MSISERIRVAMAAAGISQVELARACGVSPPSVHGWLSGKAKYLRGENLLRASKALGVSQDWLATGKGQMEASSDQRAMDGVPGAIPIRALDDDDPEFTQIPMVKLRLSAGMTGFQTDPDVKQGATLSLRRQWVERAGYHPAKLIAIPVKGESMEPTLYEGDIIIINTADTKPVDGYVYAVNYEGEAVVKRLARDAGQWWLTSDSSDQRKYHRKLCQGEACIIIGRIVRKESDRI